MTFPELVSAGLLLLAQTRPDLASEATLVTIREADTASPYAGFFDMAHPELVWINPENVYTPEMMRGALAHELTHHQDWRNGLLTLATCGEDYLQAEYRAWKAQRDWQPWADAVMLGYIRGNYSKPCPAV